MGSGGSKDFVVLRVLVRLCSRGVSRARETDAQIIQGSIQVTAWV